MGWRNLNKAQKLRRGAFALWSTPIIMLFPIWWGYLHEPTLILEYWEISILFFGLPLLAAALLYYFAAKVGSEA